MQTICCLNFWDVTESGDNLHQILHFKFCWTRPPATALPSSPRDMAFCVAVPRAWNKLPADLKLLWSKLKTFLFESLRAQKNRLICYVMRLRSTVEGRGWGAGYKYLSYCYCRGHCYLLFTAEHVGSCGTGEDWLTSLHTRELRRHIMGIWRRSDRTFPSADLQWLRPAGLYASFTSSCLYQLRRYRMGRY